MGTIAYDAPGVAWDDPRFGWDGDEAIDARPRHTSAVIRQQVVARVNNATIVARVREAPR